MSADHLAVLVAAIAAAVGAVVAAFVAVVLGRRVQDLRHAVEELRRETVPLVRDARVVVDQAATEMVRVGDVLDSTEAVSATVDSASRLAYRAFANPVVKLLAYGTGVGSALRRFLGRRPVDDDASAAAANGHRRSQSAPPPTGHAAPRSRTGIGRRRRMASTR
jgi:hypothetical protein